MAKICGVGLRQQGMGMLGFITIIALVAFFVTLILKLGPAYMNYWTIRTIMNEVAAQTEMLEGGARGIAGSIDRRLNVNSVYGRSSKDFVIKKIENNLYNVTVDYEDRKHLFYNIDAVLTFSHQVEVKIP